MMTSFLSVHVIHKIHIKLQFGGQSDIHLVKDMSSDAWYDTSDTNFSRRKSFDAPGQLDWDGDFKANPLPCNSASFLESDVGEPEITCLLSANGDDRDFLYWNGPSLLSPLTAAGDVFRYVSATLPQKVIDWLEIQFSVTHKYTGEAVTVLPFFLPRRESILGDIRRSRAQIIDTMRRFTRSKCAADFSFHLLIWPRNDYNSLGWTPGDLLQTATYPDPERALDPEWFIRNLSSYF
ncbi:hypothetical protein ASPFODRAFT_518378 [Aspergillus luchuensis CBS 106.47]|uniref:Uncharacterized protein n=1 Tax=Aspergillus luchuensis (strain CBS 106.47) TaxID=1137211 RepID=A0A1M3SZI2_ASPLC|nr:hypothetical protein ASPFODRAFT_518378 [Aspergillus luchuensis CBS 106.47]